MTENLIQAREPSSKGKTRKTDPTAPIRKRRKRTVVSGAPDDCFTCAKRGTKCDRRRPYCSQCLDLGHECSGYKTTLTWGMGVASRGKLRGQKLPVMESTTKSTSNQRQGQKQRQQKQIPLPPIQSQPSHLPSNPPTTASSGTNTVGVTFVNSDLRRPSDGSNVSDLSNGISWSMDMPDPHTWSNAPSIPPQIYRLPLPSRPMVSNGPSPILDPEALMEYPPLPSEATTFDIWPIEANICQPVATEGLEQKYTTAKQDADEEISSHDHENHENIMIQGAAHSPSYSQMLLARAVGRTPRLRYLISYYTEVIAPMVVAFDSPNNPFRTQILRLAMGSEALQEAIATLATNNLRRRRQGNGQSTERTLPARMSSMAHRALTDQAFQDRYGISVPEGYAREENHHRGMAVKALNADLADPQRRLSDSVLATILILCLFHGCDTGVAEFKSQFAGVTRLLAIRMRHSSIVTDDLKWIIRMFSWLDTLTATTNDRDVQLRGKCLEITSTTDGEWGLENLAGCDGRLFKMISQLGRLNVLSQNQQPNESRSADFTLQSTSLPPNMLFPGWDTVTSSSPPGSLTNSGYGFSLPTPPSSTDEARKSSSPEFWTEWYSLRQRLESWRFDPPSVASIPSPSPSSSNTAWNPPTFIPEYSPSQSYQVAQENLQDVYQISECFRHAALLYCERLAEPGLPSQHPRIQHLVHLAMHCLCAVQSDVYLLWPLFIVGSECVQENHRATIRDRCNDISKDSGFVNNISCLDLLERIWAEHSDESSHPIYPSGFGPPPLDKSGSSITAHAFRWSHVMQAKRGDGEYMVA
ncbi:hypothetical protein N7495_001819 [Penicillium taxi]|uniref:uncharacterized protein n=1 Tax=Penicillium taxi TaxID=168475 RepID=UPI002544D7FB|nr:uncharacterized protein N7495_001819 [Penicillium taxi]KAJ5909137.1 hypothetical protein N7495_001819 [Penicillium taxi]